jgi:hypothetical protein
MEAADSSRMSVAILKTKRYHNPEVHNVNIHFYVHLETFTIKVRVMKLF